MRGQFYIISVTVIIVIATSIITLLPSMNPNMLQPIGEGSGFQAYSFQRAAVDLTLVAQKIVSTSGMGGAAEGVLSNFTSESSRFAEKNGMRVTWGYSIAKLGRDNTTILYNTSFASGSTVMADSFTVTRIAKWRQGVNITSTGGQVTINLTFAQNRVSNCSREIRAYDSNLNQQKANVTYEEYNRFIGWHYQLPLTIYAGAYNRTDVLVEPYVDFTKQLKLIPNASIDFDPNSTRVIEYDDVGRFLQEAPSQFIPISGFHYQANASGNLLWVVNGSTPAGTNRYYSILFDTLDNGNKPAPNYTSYLTITDNMASGCYIEINNSKARYRILKGNCGNDDSPSGGLKNAWIENGSGNDLIASAPTDPTAYPTNFPGQYFNSTSGESGSITSYNISEGGLSRLVSYQTSAGFNVSLTAYTGLPYYKMDVSAPAATASDSLPMTEHHGGGLCEYQNDSTHKWAEVYSPYWGGEGYGIVGFNATATDLYNSNYSCSRIRHRISSLNWSIYTIFRTPDFTAKDLYLQKSIPVNIITGLAQPYSGYCTLANITFGNAGSREYWIYYGYSKDSQVPYPGGTPVMPSSIQTRPEEDVSETTVY